MKTPILISLLDHFFEINKLDLVMGYLTGKNDNRKEVKDFLKQLDEQDPMNVLLIALFQEQIPPILHCFFSNNNLDKLSMEKMRNVFINKVRHSFIVSQSCIFLLSTLQFADNLSDIAISSGSSILKILLMYYLILPFLLKCVTQTNLINEYIKEKISLYKKLSSKINVTKFKDLVDDDKLSICIEY